MQQKMWRVCIYESSRSGVLLDGEKYAMFDLEQGVAQGCSLSPIFKLSDGESWMVVVCEPGEQLQKLIDVIHSYCQKWRLKANVSKCV